MHMPHAYMWASEWRMAMNGWPASRSAALLAARTFFPPSAPQTICFLATDRENRTAGARLKKRTSSFSSAAMMLLFFLTRSIVSPHRRWSSNCAISCAPHLQVE